MVAASRISGASPVNTDGISCGVVCTCRIPLRFFAQTETCAVQMALSAVSTTSLIYPLSVLSLNASLACTSFPSDGRLGMHRTRELTYLTYLCGTLGACCPAVLAVSYIHTETGNVLLFVACLAHSRLRQALTALYLGIGLGRAEALGVAWYMSSKQSSMDEPSTP